MKRSITACLVLLCGLLPANGQEGDDYRLWSATQKLTVADFGIQTRGAENTTSFAQFTVFYESKGWGLFSKNVNNKVRNYFLRSASWIDTTADVGRSLRYQQTLFDLCEVYTRQFRKALRENRKKTWSGMDFIHDLNKRCMADFARRRLVYDRETAYAANEPGQKEWEEQIRSELAALADYAFDK